MPTLEDKIKDLLKESETLKSAILDESKKKVSEEDDEDEKVKDDEKSEIDSDEDDEKVDEGKEKADGGDKKDDDEEDDKKDKKIFNVKEDVDALFNGEDGLTEDFRLKAETIFEAAVYTRVKEEVTRLEEEFEGKLEEKFDEVVSGLVEHVDGYLNLMVEQWIEQNEIALTSGMKNDILEGFVEGMKDLFTEHYIEVPEEKLNMFEALEEQVDELNTKLDEAVAYNVKIHSELNERKRDHAIKEACEGFSDLDVEKFKNLAEELSFGSIEEFEGKLQTIRENYFTKTAKKDETNTVFISEGKVEEKAEIPANMKQYTQALSSLYTKN